MEWTAHCGCVCAIRPDDGQPIALLRPCAFHASSGATHDDVAGENRAMSLARKALVDAYELDNDVITVEIADGDRCAVARGPNGESALVQKASHEEYLAQHAEAASFARKG